MRESAQYADLHVINDQRGRVGPRCFSRVSETVMPKARFMKSPRIDGPS